jgi:hypothetical protein
MTFQKAVKHEAKLRLAIAGPSGSGKTYTSLAIATALANGGKIALVDTEHGSASKYADIFDFDVLEMQAPFHPKRFVEAITDAGAAGYSVVVLDSLTHAWSGPGGLLELVDGFAARMKSANTFAAWKDATPIQNALVEGIVAAPLHVIATMRSKQEYVLTQDDRGKQTPRKVGMAPQQRDGFEYEFDVFIDMDIDNTGIVQKTRCPELTGKVFKRPGADVAGILQAWLSGEKHQPTEQPKSASNGAQQAAGDHPGFEVWADWSHVDHAIQWGLSQGVFDHENHARNAYAKCKTECAPKKASDMWQCWYQDVQRRIADKTAVVNANAAADEHADGYDDIDPPTAGDWLDS